MYDYSYCGIVNVPVVTCIFINYQSFVCAEVSTVFYACYLLTCVFGYFTEALFHVLLTVTFASQRHGVCLIFICVLFYIHG